jgi:hypothetical protein
MGVLNAILVGAVLVLVGLIIVWILGYVGVTIPDNIQKVYLVIVAIVVIIAIVATLLGGTPPISILR